jgi:hypothetical protein
VKRGDLVPGAGIVSRAMAMLKFRRDLKRCGDFSSTILHPTRSCASLGGRDLCSPVEQSP